MANTSNTTLTTNLNVTPYHDDYDKTKNFYRILFKPGFAVQARELTQSQTILQKQIDRFGKHIFQEGSIVTGGAFILDIDVYYVKIRDNDTQGVEVDLSMYKNKKIRGLTSGVEAYVVEVADGLENTDEPKTLFVRYTSSNIQTGYTEFVGGETLISDEGTMVTLSTDYTGFGSLFTINEGVFFAKEHFIYFEKQTVVLDRYSIEPTCQVGFTILEEIVTSSEDTTLLDPALGSYNYSAPGADRLKLTPILTRLDFDEEAGEPNYVKLFSIKDGVTQERYQRSQYSVIRDELAKRTYDESGDYYVNGLNIRIRENVDNGENGGYDANGDSSYLSIGIEPGTAYVKGYEYSTLVTRYLTLSKANTVQDINSQVISTRYGNRVVLDEFTGTWEHDTGKLVSLYDTAQNRISEKKWSTSAQTGAVIGTAKIKTVEYENGQPGQANAQYNLYLFDVKMTGSNTFSNVRSIFVENTGGRANLGADVVLTDNQAVLNETTSTLIYPVGASAVKSIRDENGDIDTTFNFKRTLDVTVSSSGTFTIPLSGSEIFPYGTGTLSSEEKEDLILNVNESFSVNLGGTVYGNTGSNILNGTSTNFTRLSSGEKIEFVDLYGPAGTFIVDYAASDTVLYLKETLSSNVVANTIVKTYKTGDIVSLSSKSATTGAERTVTATSSSLSVDLDEDFTTTRSFSVTFKGTRTTGREINKILRANRYVVINCQSHPETTNGVYGLGVSDVYRIKQIRKHDDNFTSNTEGTDVTTQFVFDNGQRDEFYDHAKITSKINLTTSDRLLVQFDYFEPDFTLGVGYFSVDSYPIDDNIISDTTIQTAEIPIYKSTITGENYDLRNCLDFRPVKERTITDSTTVSGATENPSSTETFTKEASGFRMPAVYEQLSFDFNYYLPRRDIVIIDRLGNFSIIQGTPSTNPITPLTPDNAMAIASLYITPYPSLSPFNAQILGRKDLQVTQKKTAYVRFTMRDIGVLKNRIENLEYYTTLNALERNALDYQILDENGLNRFKNGVFVDTFSDHSLGATYNPEYQIVVDKEEKSIRPMYNMTSLGYNPKTLSNIVQRGDVLLLNYNEVDFLNQPFATTIRNVETSTYRFIGSLYMNPATDFWADTQNTPDNLVSVGPESVSQEPLSQEWNAWQTKITGYRIFNADTGALLGTFTDERTMRNTVSNLTSLGGPNINVRVETISDNNRTGTETFQGITETSTNLGERVVDVSLQPYIRPQVIRVQVLGLKANTRFYPFFDGENVSSLVTPLTVEEFVNHVVVDSPLPMTNEEIESLSPEPLVTITVPPTSNTVGTSPVDPPAEEFVALPIVTESINSVRRSRTWRRNRRERRWNRWNNIAQERGDEGLISILPVLEEFVETPTTEFPELVTAFAEDLQTVDIQDIIIPNTGITTANTGYLSVQNTIFNEGDELYSDANGELYFTFRIPASRFRVGDRELKVTDNMTNEDFATSRAASVFTAHGLVQQKQDTVLTLRSVVVQSRAVSETATRTQNSLIQREEQPPPETVDALAYSFFTTVPAGVDGVFVTGFDVFFSAKSETLGVWFELREMDAGGSITKKQIPFSEVWMTTDDVKLSSDGSVPTRVRFPVPIFLYGNIQYALIIHPEAGNPDYYVFVSDLGDIDLLTGQKVVSRIGTGTLYTTNNNTNFDIVPDLDLKIRIYRADFDTSATGTALIGNRPLDVLKVIDVSSPPLVRYGEPIISNDRLTLTGNTSYINVNDILVGNVSNTNTTVTMIDAGVYHMGNVGFIAGETVSIANANGTVYSYTSTVTSVENSKGNLFLYRSFEDVDTVYIVNSNGKFIDGETIRGKYSGQTAVVDSVDKMRYSVIDFEPNYINFASTICNFEMKTTSNVGVAGTFTRIQPNENYNFGDERAVYSRTTEIDDFSSEQTNQVRVTMKTSSRYLSPVLDLGRTHNIYIDNLVNSNTDNETLASGGELYNKYISKIVTLAEGQDAEDIKVIVTAYRPVNTDVKVWVRISHSEDAEAFESKQWIPLEFERLGDESVYSSLANKNDFIEYVYRIPASYLTGPNGEVQYTTDTGATFTGYKQFSVKVGLVADNSAIVPRCADLRVIALQL